MTRASKLFTLCTTKRWDDAIEFITARPEEANSLQSTGKRGAAPISVLQIVLAHSKCRGDVPLDLIDTLLEAAPDMAAQRHLYTGNLPLHAVFYNPFYSASKRTKIAEKIIAACPSSVTMRNKDGRTPLHTICSQHCNYEPIVALLRAGKKTASWPDKNGDLPIHLACRSLKSPNKSIRALFDAHPEGVICFNNEASTPLDIAKSQQTSNAKHRSRISLLKKLQSAVPKFPCRRQDGLSRENTSDAEMPVEHDSEKGRNDCAHWENGTENVHGLFEESEIDITDGFSAFTMRFMERNSPHILLSMRSDVAGHDTLTTSDIAKLVEPCGVSYAV